MDAELTTVLYTVDAPSPVGPPSGAVDATFRLSLEKREPKANVLHGRIRLDMGEFRVTGAIAVYGGYLASFVDGAKAVATGRREEASLFDLDFGDLLAFHRLARDADWYVSGSWDMFAMSFVKIPYQVRLPETKAVTVETAFRFQGLRATDDAVNSFVHQLRQILVTSEVSLECP